MVLFYSTINLFSPKCPPCLPSFHQESAECFRGRRRCCCSVRKQKHVRTQRSWTDERPHSAEQLLIHGEMSACIRSCLAKLPEPYRTVLALSESEGFRAREIAEIMGTTLETVKIRLHRSRALLRQEIEKNCRVYRDERNELACEPTEEFSRKKNGFSE